ncbi:hypothetical protein AcV7_008274 [Taiwanofungus camphoratus]|nr:hypothetical protein AcV7_008274 [Antrodia cinnamomea]
MANASAKRIAQQNAETIKNLRLGMLGSGVLSLLLRLVFRTGSLSLSKMPIWLYALSMVPALFLSRYLERIGSPRRDPITGTLISSGEDLARPGILEWCFDVIYITCKKRLFIYTVENYRLSNYQGHVRLEAARLANGFGGCIWS